MKPLIDLLHLLLCDMQHSYEMFDIADRKQDICYFYLENDIAECHDMKDHLKWKTVLEQFKKDLEFSTDQEAMNFIRESIKLSQEYKTLISRNSKRVEFFQCLI